MSLRVWRSEENLLQSTMWVVGTEPRLLGLAQVPLPAGPPSQLKNSFLMKQDSLASLRVPEMMHFLKCLWERHLFTGWYRSNFSTLAILSVIWLIPCCRELSLDH